MDPPPSYQASGYPPQPGYPPEQPGYPPQQPGYPPQQPGYPPQQPGYPPQQPGYPPQQPGFQSTNQTSTTNTVVVTSQPVVTTVMPLAFGEFPVSMTCPSCRASIVTAVVTEPGTFAYLLFFLMCIFGFWICCCIPFCIDSCKDAIHSCPNCRAQLGVYKRM
ncbi:cell death-inducing p53-target protein 1 homolog [Rhopilema esculentum]|uniref:cell death-inducing p53-target protein 1 homolog n=1 Tax=Rhopilema esculentum TaxID=499914 RepID=UPI0031D6694D